MKWHDDVPDQRLDPPEPRVPDYWDRLEAQADRLNDEARERAADEADRLMGDGE